jgi:thioesterase domain-containing protein
VLGLQLTWWDTPDEVEWDVQEIARTCYAAIIGTQPKEPYLLVGWSFGGVLALETARLLAANGNAARIIALDTILPNAGSHQDVREAMEKIDGVLAYLSGEKMDAMKGYGLPDDVRSKLRWLNIPEEIYALDRDDLVRHLAVMRGLGVANLAYVPSPVECHVTLVEAESGAQPDWLDGTVKETWRPLARDLDVVRVPGNHHSFLRYPLVRALADSLRREIRENG